MTKEKIRQNESERKESSTVDYFVLILYNDEVHTFEFVIEALMEVCGHEFIQASQCALITHTRGSCDIRKGDFDLLKKMKNALSDRELTVTIE
jgi:ATP-dependent Clp protease adaptor protein ClpS